MLAFFSSQISPHLQEDGHGSRSIWTAREAEGRKVRSSKASSFCPSHKALQLHAEPTWQPGRGRGHSVPFFPFQLLSRSSSSAWVKAAGPQ